MAIVTDIYVTPTSSGAGRGVITSVDDSQSAVAALIDETRQENKAMVELTASSQLADAGTVRYVNVDSIVLLQSRTV